MIISDSSNLSTSIKKKVVVNWNRDFHFSNENCLRLMNAYYSQMFEGKENIWVYVKLIDNPHLKICKKSTLYLIKNCQSKSIM